MNPPVSEEDLWRYIDEECSADERLAIEDAIAADPELHEHFSRLVALHERMNQFFNARQLVPDRVNLPPRKPDMTFDNRLN